MLGSTLRAHAWMPPSRFNTVEKPFCLRKVATYALRPPVWHMTT
ncbi:uncharacterized protein METZ01_LOCUS153438, partial [marine metagenome]